MLNVNYNEVMHRAAWRNDNSDLLRVLKGVNKNDGAAEGGGNRVGGYGVGGEEVGKEEVGGEGVGDEEVCSQGAGNGRGEGGGNPNDNMDDRRRLRGGDNDDGFLGDAGNDPPFNDPLVHDPFFKDCLPHSLWADPGLRYVGYSLFSTCPPQAYSHSRGRKILVLVVMETIPMMMMI